MKWPMQCWRHANELLRLSRFLVACNGPCLRCCAGGDAVNELLFFLLGALVMAVVWWLANKVTKVVDQPDFDNEIHWHKYHETQSKRGDL